MSSSSSPSSKLLPAWSNIPKPVIGMLHIPALPGSPRYAGNIISIHELVLRDADTLVTGGVHALMMENFGDVPFYPGQVPTHVAAHMTTIAAEIRRRFDKIPLGINVLRNDGLTALSIAHAVGAHFIRVNVLCGARVTDQGIIQGVAHDLLRLRADLHAKEIKIFADVDVKHSAALAQRPIADEVDDTLERGLADALVVSGAGTGKTTDLSKVKSVKSAASETAIFIGSGITAETIMNYLSHADGFIVGTAFKENGIASNAVDVNRVNALIQHLR
jgi:membrane complex biogenesis BtpA family protein